ncbi:MAG TPA: MBL fold metallo-hydrolase [Intrasporangium sp.]|uniref:MBL fold metallo-hydrolase n=1 Tax=Intrasporangium sp. TaxID=1925024 RepID=UPI002B47EBCF|nr:MBL fold metallo-hydrolase [Intrasporangium sp.]HKX67632.1 MBL fold metallo-hydrolase [Intrasporangium sp.]
MEVTFLGTAGWMPSDGRETASVAVRWGQTLVLLDAGTGLRRLVTGSSLVDGLTQVHVLLSHFHLDHTVGLGYLSAIQTDAPITVHGPGAWLYGRPTSEILADLIQPPYQPKRLRDLPLEVADLGPEGLEIDGVPVQARRQDRHSAPSVGLRLGDELAYVTDTAYDEGSASLAQGARLLLHEAFAEDDGDPTHSSPTEAAHVAEAAGVGNLRLLHLAPTARPRRLAEQAQTVLPTAEVPADLETISL